MSDELQYYNISYIFFLNDLSVVDGANELYATQFGPQKFPSTADKVLFHCSWDEAHIKSDGRLPAQCGAATGVPASYGLNGIAIHPSGTLLWVNDLIRSRLLLLQRNASDGKTLRHVGSMSLPVSYATAQTLLGSCAAAAACML